MEVAVDAARWRAAISAFLHTPMLWFGFPSLHTAAYPILCSALCLPRQLPLLEDAHTRKGKLLCTSWTAGQGTWTKWATGNGSPRAAGCSRTAVRGSSCASEIQVFPLFTSWQTTLSGLGVMTNLFLPLAPPEPCKYLPAPPWSPLRNGMWDHQRNLCDTGTAGSISRSFTRVVHCPLPARISHFISP